ncbi:MAG: hypothetical protein KGH72_01310 [Candidatus Micrarchaeota archaeon]|nr:hypothetical protein [Candidatus Micrarchaeota archaeon]
MAENAKTLAEALWKNPTTKGWEAFSGSLAKGGIKYYKIFYEKGKLANKEDLRYSYAELYDSKEKAVCKVPIFRKDGAKIKGATIYLSGLLNINK